MIKTSRAQFLLRFDDICPTMNWGVWNEVVEILRQNSAAPLLAIVPDNLDPHLRVDDPQPDFWDRAREWQSWGWSVALHGYQHRYVTESKGIVGRRALSEFAGLTILEQRRKLECGCNIFKREHIIPSVWVAPGHTFDWNTCSLLPEFGIKIISDGFFLYPHRQNDGILWIPQQLWSLRSVPEGVWTVCYHINTWTASDIRKFGHDLRALRGSLCTVGNLTEIYGNRQPNGLVERVKRGNMSYFLLRAIMYLKSLRQISIRGRAS